MEKYLVINWSDHLEFKDSLQFLLGSLESQVDNLKKSGSANFKRMRAQYPDEGIFQLLLRKGIYPYDWVNDREKLNEQNLPPREAFYNSLRQEECSESDYEHALNVYQKVKCKTFLDYHNLYLSSMLHPLNFINNYTL